MAKDDFKHIPELLKERPKTKAGLIRCFWPEIRQALNTGYTLKEICLALNRDGFSIGYSRLRSLVAPLRRVDIAEMEQTARGPYGGCVGYFSFNGNLDCCITIRTALIKNGRAWVQAGGGWVNDSTPEGEYQETVNKSKAMLKAVAMAETFGS